MSLAFPLALFSAIPLSAVVGWVAARIFRARAVGCLVSFLGLPVLCVAMFWAWIHIGTASGRHVPYEDVSHRMIGKAIPPEATDIDFYQHFSQIQQADYSIAPDAFLSWVRSNNWEAKPIGEQDARVWPLAEDQLDPVEIRDGFRVTIFDPQDNGATGYIVYDADRKRAYYRFNSF
jgi:hypothetical protein